MMTLRAKLEELLMLPASDVQHEAMLYLQRAFDWPVSTQVRLNDTRVGARGHDEGS